MTREYEPRDWACCQDCDAKRPIRNLKWVFRRPGSLSEQPAVFGPYHPFLAFIEGPAAPFRVCMEEQFCHAAKAARPPRAPDLVGWVAAGKKRRRV